MTGNIAERDEPHRAADDELRATIAQIAARLDVVGRTINREAPEVPALVQQVVADLEQLRPYAEQLRHGRGHVYYQPGGGVTYNDAIRLLHNEIARAETVLSGHRSCVERLARRERQQAAAGQLEAVWARVNRPGSGGGSESTGG